MLPISLCLLYSDEQALDTLIELQVLTAVEEKQLLDAIPFQPSDLLIKSLYSSRLNKVTRLHVMTPCNVKNLFDFWCPV